MDLPKGWTFSRLEELTKSPKRDIVDGPFGSDLKASEYINEGVPIIRLQNIDRNRFLKKNIKYISQEKAQELSRHSFIVGDVVVTKLGDPVGKACLIPKFLDTGIIVADVVRARIDEKVANKDFVSYAINSPEVISRINLDVKGSTRPRVNLSHIRALEIPLAPLNEQRRIVAKLEKLLEKVESSRTRLEKIPAILKRFRQSVLATACSGRLTADWREIKIINESSTKFLERIHVLRRQVWSKKRADSSKLKYPEPDVIDSTNLPDLPESWEWASADTVCSQITDGEHIQPPYQFEGYPMLSAKHVRDGFVTMEGAGLISKPDFRKALERCKPLNDDILIVSVGATTGRSAIVKDYPPFAIVRSVLLLKPLLPTQFLHRHLQSPWCFMWMTKASGASAQPHLYIKDMKRMPVPIPPLSEQHEIIRRVEELFALADRIEARYQKAKAQVNKLTQSILAKAFRGQLVPQDPSDESASELLNRFKAQKVEQGHPKETKRGKKIKA